MPSDQGGWFHNREHAAPIDQPRQRNEHDPSRIVGTTRLYLPLDVHCELLPQEQILSGELGTRPRAVAANRAISGMTRKSVREEAPNRDQVMAPAIVRDRRRHAPPDGRKAQLGPTARPAPTEIGHSEVFADDT